MADRFYLILEILAVLLCLHGLYGEKFKWNSYTILFVVIEFIAFQVEDTYNLVTYRKIILYVMLFVYSKLQFESIWRISIINYILCIILSAIMQMICYFPIMFFYNKLSSYISLSVNILLVILIFAIYKTGIFHKISLYMRPKGKIVITFLVSAITFITIVMHRLKFFKSLDATNYFILISGIIFVFILLLLLQKERLYNRQIKTEISLNKLYGNALTELIEKVRINQHNYKNQLTAIQGMVYTAQSIEELKEEQAHYYNNIMREDKYSNIISGNNDPVIAGFLYSKLCSDNLNYINVECLLHLNKIENSLFMLDVIKIIGVLIDNAIEEIQKDKYQYKGMEIKIWESNELSITVGNVCDYINRTQIAELFKKGTSSKGNDRGLGLYNVKNIVKNWNGQISVDNSVRKNEISWFYITIQIPIK